MGHGRALFSRTTSSTWAKDWEVVPSVRCFWRRIDEARSWQSRWRALASDDSELVMVQWKCEETMGLLMTLMVEMDG